MVNSLKPCSELFESLLTATTFPSLSIPYKITKKKKKLYKKLFSSTYIVIDKENVKIISNITTKYLQMYITMNMFGTTLITL